MARIISTEQFSIASTLTLIKHTLCNTFTTDLPQQPIHQLYGLLVLNHIAVLRNHQHQKQLLVNRDVQKGVLIALDIGVLLVGVNEFGEGEVDVLDLSTGEGLVELAGH